MVKTSGRKKKCPGCKETLSKHSFGTPSSQCEGRPLVSASDHEDTDGEERKSDPEDNTPKTNQEATDSTLSQKIATQQQRNASYRKKIESLRMEEELLSLQKEELDLKREVERRRVSASKDKSHISASSNVSDKIGAKQPSVTLVDLRQDEGIHARVERQLAQLGLTEADSSSADEDPAEDHRSTSTKKAGKLRSGRVAKATSRVTNPQLWPHSELNVSYAAKEICYDDLSMEEFVAGYVSILNRGNITETEKRLREEHLIQLMYLAISFEWKAVVAYHGAVLVEILTRIRRLG
jgi:hypothetical protein